MDISLERNFTGRSVGGHVATWWAASNESDSTPPETGHLDTDVYNIEKLGNHAGNMVPGILRPRLYCEGEQRYRNEALAVCSISVYQQSWAGLNRVYNH